MIPRGIREKTRLAVVAELVDVFDSAKHPAYKYSPFVGSALSEKVETRIDRVCSCLRAIGDEKNASIIATSFKDWVDYTTFRFVSPEEDREMRAKQYSPKSDLQKVLDQMCARSSLLEGLKAAALRLNPDLEMEADEPEPRKTSVVDPYGKELVWEAERRQWRLMFRGRSTHWGKNKAIDDLATLLQAPHKKFAAHTLDGRDRTPDGRKAMVDAEGVRKAARAVGQRHGRLMKNIAIEHPELWRFLNESVEMGTDCRYVPPIGEPDWVVICRA